MTHLDNTVLAQIMLTLSGQSSAIDYWKVFEKLYYDVHHMQIANHGALPAEAAVQAQLDTALAHIKRSGAPATCLAGIGASKSRFFNGLNGRAWWPQRKRVYDLQRYFELILPLQFTWYVAHNYPDQDAAWAATAATCRRCRVPQPEIDQLRQCGTPEQWIDALIASARQAAKARQPLHRPPASPHPPLAAPPVPALQRLEGQILTAPCPAFRRWRDLTPPPDWDQLREVSGALIFSDGQVQPLTYLELYGSPQAGSQEYIEGCNLFVQHTDISANVAASIHTLAFDEAMAQEAARAEALGYTHHPPKMYLHHLDYLADASDPGRGTLTLSVGRIDYLAHHVFRREAASNPALQAALVDTLCALRGNAEHRLRGLPWTCMGAGIWPIVRDEAGRGYLVCAYRNPTKVAEVPACLSYGASGSLDASDQSPASAVIRELTEELGLAPPAP